MDLEELCKRAHDVRIKAGMLDTKVKNETLNKAADALLAHETDILAANAIDVKSGQERNMPAGLLDRLTLNHDRIAGMADGLRQIAKLDDPIGEVLSMKKRPNELITRCLRKFPENTDPDIVAMKIGLIDITNSTHLSQHKSKISMVELADIISSIPDIDARIAIGDPEIVNKIAKSNGKVNLFSFASKYCCYHNRNLYERDDYSILDTVLKEYLPRYFDDITRGQIQKWQDSFNYQAYNDYISKKLDEYGITVSYRKRKFDHFVWYKNR